MSTAEPLIAASFERTSGSAASLFRRPTQREALYLALVVAFYVLGVAYVWYHGLSIKSLFLYGLVQPPGVTGESARLVEVETPLSWNLLQVGWYILVKGSAVLVELFQYWVVGMLIAGGLVVFVSWERVRGQCA